jgi:hypothetical protein
MNLRFAPPNRPEPRRPSAKPVGMKLASEFDPTGVGSNSDAPPTRLSAGGRGQPEGRGHSSAAPFRRPRTTPLPRRRPRPAARHQPPPPGAGGSLIPPGCPDDGFHART